MAHTSSAHDMHVMHTMWMHQKRVRFCIRGGNPSLGDTSRTATYSKSFSAHLNHRVGEVPHNMEETGGHSPLPMFVVAVFARCSFSCDVLPLSTQQLATFRVFHQAAMGFYDVVMTHGTTFGCQR